MLSLFAIQSSGSRHHPRVNMPCFAFVLVYMSRVRTMCVSAISASILLRGGRDVLMTRGDWLTSMMNWGVERYQDGDCANPDTIDLEICCAEVFAP